MSFSYIGFAASDSLFPLPYIWLETITLVIYPEPKVVVCFNQADVL